MPPNFASTLVQTKAKAVLHRLGHSIVSRREDRTYLEAGNTTRLAEVEAFTFEPHIRQVGGRWGFKQEEIYRFETGTMQVL